MTSPYVGAEIDMIDAWVEDRLSGWTPFDTIATGLTSKIYNQFAPEGTPYPYIIFQAQEPPRDVRGVGSARVMVDTLYVVKGVAQAEDFHGLRALAREIDAAMTVPNGDLDSIGGAAIFASIREQQFALTEIESGKQYRHLGGQYRIHAQATE